MAQKILGTIPRTLGGSLRGSPSGSETLGEKPQISGKYKITFDKFFRIISGCKGDFEILEKNIEKIAQTFPTFVADKGLSMSIYAMYVGEMCCWVQFAYDNAIGLLINVDITFDCAGIRYTDIGMKKALGGTCLDYKIGYNNIELESHINLIGKNNCFIKVGPKNQQKAGTFSIDLAKRLNEKFGVTKCTLQDASTIEIGGQTKTQQIKNAKKSIKKKPKGSKIPTRSKKPTGTKKPANPRISLTFLSLFKYGKTWYERHGFVSSTPDRMDHYRKILLTIDVKEIRNSLLKTSSAMNKKSNYASSSEYEYLEEIRLYVNLLSETMKKILTIVKPETLYSEFMRELFERSPIDYANIEQLIMPIVIQDYTNYIYKFNRDSRSIFVVYGGIYSSVISMRVIF